MGEFGRTPKINPNAGRDHFPKVFNVALAGGGVKGGQVIGASNADGTDVKDRPVTVPDLMASICHALKVDPAKEVQTPSAGRSRSSMAARRSASCSAKNRAGEFSRKPQSGRADVRECIGRFKRSARACCAWCMGFGASGMKSPTRPAVRRMIQADPIPNAILHWFEHSARGR